MLRMSSLTTPPGPDRLRITRAIGRLTKYNPTSLSAEILVLDTLSVNL